MGYLYIIYVFIVMSSFYLKIFTQKVNETGRCVMREDCGKAVPCVYNGQPQPLNTSSEAFLSLKMTCIHMDLENDNNLCCDENQVKLFLKQLGLLGSLFQRCPSCYYNLASVFCTMTCGKNQESFLKVTSTQEMENKKLKVATLDYYMNTEFSEAMFQSCKGVSFPQGNAKVLDTMCSQCTPIKWLNFMTGFSPFKINFKLGNERNLNITGSEIVPMNIKTTPCSKAPQNGMSPCSCADCPCVMPSYNIQTSRWTVFNISVITFGTMILFGVFFVIFSAYFVIHVYYRGRKDECDLSRVGKILNRSEDAHDKVTCCQKLGHRMDKGIAFVFSRWGTFCASKPWWILLCGSVFIFVLGMGLVRFTVVTDPVELWSSSNSQSRIEREYFNTHFRPFYRTEQIIITRKNGSVFDIDFLEEVFDMQQNVLNITAEVDGKTITLGDICFSPMGYQLCTVQSVLNWFQNNITRLRHHKYFDHIQECIKNPFNVKDALYQDLSCFGDYGGPVFPYVALGGFSDKDYDNATALIITILVNNGRTNDENVNSRAWEKEYVSFMKNYHNENMTIAFSSERSIEDELNRESQSDIGTIAISYAVMFIYVSFALGQYTSFRRLLIDSKVTLGLCGIITVLASVVCSLGAFSYAGISATLIVVEVIPFLVLAVGVDNIFILVQTYQRSQREVDETKEEHIGRIVGTVAPSMLLTSISESLCFFLGALTEMPAVRVFALYAGLAIAIAFILQMSCFVAILSIDATRFQVTKTAVEQ